MKVLNENSSTRQLVDVQVGEGVKIFHFVNAYGCTIGDNTKVGTFVEIQKNARIGRRTRKVSANAAATAK